MHTLLHRLLLASVALVALVGCAASDGQDQAGHDALVRVDLDKSDPAELLRYYFGGYAADDGADPFASGLVVEQGGRHYVDLDALEARFAGARAALEPAVTDGVLNWDELAAFVAQTYYDARSLPPTLDALRRDVPYGQPDTAWFRVDLTGVMTTATRRLYVPVSALRHALGHYRENGDRLLYPAGTYFIGEHRADGEHLETTLMRKRADGFWDYATYGRHGRLAPQTTTPPRPLDTPTQCVGCHFGSRLFEPERSFPAAAPPGPHGPRGIDVPGALRDAEVVAFFDEHRKRSDHVLGLYNTLFVSALRADRQAGRLAPRDAALLERLGL